jgi:hypothetical protein
MPRVNVMELKPYTTEACLKLHETAVVKQHPDRNYT